MIELADHYLSKDGQKIDLAFQMMSEVVRVEDTLTAAHAQLLIGDYYYRKGDPAKAAQEYLNVVLQSPKDELVAAALLRAAEMAVLLGKRSDAQELIERLEQRYPESEWAEEGRKLLKDEK